MVAKLFTPSVACPTCLYPNDFTFRFCQLCGYQRHIFHETTTSSTSVIDVSTLDARLRELAAVDQATSYARQKHSLQAELEVFLASLPGRPTIATVVPRDLCRFLVHKDRHGKTQVHSNGCRFLGQRGVHDCGCAFRLSYKTVDSYIGKLRAIFHDNGRVGDYDQRMGFGNPATHKSIKDYLRLITAEQLQARVTSKQATPFFVQKLVQLATYLDSRLQSPNLTPTQRFLYARDQAYFKAMFFSGDRPGDLGQVKVPEILRFPNDDGLLFNHIWGKTLRDGDANVFGIRRNLNPTICPVRGIERYVTIARQLQVDLTTGYLFRPTNPQGAIVDSHFTSSAAEARLKLHLDAMGANDGETLHGFRSGCAITLALSGTELSDIMDHVGWARRHTA